MNGNNYNRSPRCGQSSKTPNHIRFSEIVGKRLEKHCRSSSHMLRRPRGWCFDIESIEAATRAGIDFVVIYDDDNGCRYTVSLSEFINHGEKINRGYGPQICLRVQYWRVDWPTNIKLGRK